MKEAVISIRNVSMRFPGKRAGEEIAVLENVNADVARGEFVCIARRMYRHDMKPR